MAFPEIRLCSHALNSLSNLTKAEKDIVEDLLSPMKNLPLLWQVWNSLVNGSAKGQQRSAFNLLENEGYQENIKILLQQVVIEAALLLIPDCQTIVNASKGKPNCSLMNFIYKSLPYQRKELVKILSSR